MDSQGSMRSPERKTSVDVHLERTSTAQGDTQWFSRQLLKVVLMFIITLANVVVAVILGILKSKISSEFVPVNITSSKLG
jgi:hypothetical protein